MNETDRVCERTMQARCRNVGSMTLIRTAQEILVVSEATNHCRRLYSGIDVKGCAVVNSGMRQRYGCRTRPLHIPTCLLPSNYHRVRDSHVSDSATWKNGHFWDVRPPFRRRASYLPRCHQLRRVMTPRCPSSMTH